MTAEIPQGRRREQAWSEQNHGRDQAAERDEQDVQQLIAIRQRWLHVASPTVAPSGVLPTMRSIPSREHSPLIRLRLALGVVVS
jgi:hypothetical protein